MAITSDIEKLERRWIDNPTGLMFAPLAEAYRKVGNFARALEILAAGLEQHPDYVPALIVRGRCHLDAESMTEAEAAFDQALARDPVNSIALRGMAEVFERTGRVGMAIDRLAFLCEVDRGDADARRSLERLKTLAKTTGDVSPPPPTAPIEEAVAAPESEAEAPAAFDPGAWSPETWPATPPPAEDDTVPVEAELEEPPPLEGDRSRGVASEEVLDISDGDSESWAESVQQRTDPSHRDERGDATYSETWTVWASWSQLPADRAAEAEGAVPDRAEAPPEPSSVEELVDDEIVEEPPELPVVEEPVGDVTASAPGTPIGDETVSDVPTAEAIEVEEPSEPGAEWTPWPAPEPAPVASDEPLGEPDQYPAPEPPPEAEPAPVAEVGGEMESTVMTPAESDAAGEEPAWEQPAAPTTGAPMQAHPAPVADMEVSEESVATPVTAEATGEPPLVVTESMAELFLRQGHRDLALAVYRQLVERAPEDERLQEALAGLVVESAEAASATSPDSAVAEPARSWDARETGAVSVEDFLRGVLDAPPPAVTSSVLPPAIERAQSGEPTQAAGEPLSLSAVFGGAPPPPSIASPEAGKRRPDADVEAESEAEAEAEPSYDEFFGTAPAESEPTTTQGPAARPSEAEDLRQFNEWLKGLKR